MDDVVSDDEIGKRLPLENNAAQPIDGRIPASSGKLPRVVDQHDVPGDRVLEQGFDLGEMGLSTSGASRAGARVVAVEPEEGRTIELLKMPGRSVPLSPCSNSTCGCPAKRRQAAA